jgi:hypothetical protein
MLKWIGGRYLSRIYHPIRMMFDFGDKWNLNSDERETYQNIRRFK